MTPRTAVAVTGLGLVTPGGEGVGATWDAVCAGEGTAAPDPALAGLPVDFSGRVPLTEDDLDRRVGRRSWRMGRSAKLAVVAAREAVHDAGLRPADWDGARVATILGCGMGCVDKWEEQGRRLEERGPEFVSPLAIPLVLPNLGTGEVSIDLGARGIGLAPATACASGATALALARDLLAAGLCDVAVAGGVEAGVSRLSTTGFWRMGALSERGTDPARASRPFAADRDGFVVAEGAGVLVLERTADAAARGRPPRALLAGCGSTSDAHHPTAPSPDGRAAEAALRTALAEAGLDPLDIDHVNAHGTSTPLNDATEAALIARVLPHRPSVTAAKGVLGHSLGAAGGIEAALTVLTLQHRRVPPIANLEAPAPGFDLDCVVKAPRGQEVRAAVSHSFGFGGHNVVLALTRP
ncbi:beta-ketoacyl-[acyl-carrier-protein] synthase family protein [Streptomyces olivaceus]|uniref:beta-ketoacyl-[acyl-carrier-protein] synthase family protein n=1 Tax=Streptomyces olivaceus TaxID=47716 RepID=UPI001CC9D045|nr:beta-ketoacyl-[acyl-carrier-protein] synthase family protein [Streptomyces olivaceus]MBZ6175707.1 beta-ketoacyl-[acyl-carrier-protein] synthase family protein [Streptomyces olivaceus]MBZ6182149.1 beta-ketoacyl-[acyl-carrier-protein] synthase family protein [Streptomyces olivaceus]